MSAPIIVVPEPPAEPIVVPERRNPPPNSSLPPNTTEQDDISKAGQRRINLIWEYTQAVIAIAVVVANIIVGVARGLGFHNAQEFPVVLSNTLFLIVGFYFSRTNHQAIGGVGKKPDLPEYQGR